MIGCEWSEHSWHLTCEGNAWVGVVGNCSDGGTHGTSLPSAALTQFLFCNRYFIRIDPVKLKAPQ